LFKDLDNDKIKKIRNTALHADIPDNALDFKSFKVLEKLL